YCTVGFLRIRLHPVRLEPIVPLLQRENNILVCCLLSILRLNRQGDHIYIRSSSQTGRNAMQWEGREESSNVEDRRSFGPKTVAVGGVGIVVIILGLLFGFDPQN